MFLFIIIDLLFGGVPNPEAGDRKPASTYQPKELTDDDLEQIQRIHTGINFDNYDSIDVQVTGVEDPLHTEYTIWYTIHIIREKIS